MLLNTAIILFGAIINFFSLGWENTFLIVLIPYTLYVMDRLMDNKKEVLLQSSLACTVVLLTSVLIVGYLVCQFKTREMADLRTEPLYKAKLMIVDE